jgi:hypothetical protein
MQLIICLSLGTFVALQQITICVFNREKAAFEDLNKILLPGSSKSCVHRSSGQEALAPNSGFACQSDLHPLRLLEWLF